MSFNNLKTKATASVMATAMLAAAIASPLAAFAAPTTQVTLEADDSNLTVTVPTVIPFMMGADGVLTSASADTLQIVNGSNFGIHVSDVAVDVETPFTLVADAGAATEDNAVDFQFGVDGDLIDAAAPTLVAGSYDLMPTGAAGATLTLKAEGNAKNVSEDISTSETLANIRWSFAAGYAQA